MGNIKVTTPPQAEYKGRIITKIGNWYQVSGKRKGTLFKSLAEATDSIK